MPENQCSCCANTCCCQMPKCCPNDCGPCCCRESKQSLCCSRPPCPPKPPCCSHRPPLPLPPLPCTCCRCNQRNKKAIGKFRLAWVSEMPNQCNVEPEGWQVEFCDTPDIVIERCRQMINWVTSPPIPRCAMQPLETTPGSIERELQDDVARTNSRSVISKPSRLSSRRSSTAQHTLSTQNQAPISNRTKESDNESEMQTSTSHRWQITAQDEYKRTLSANSLSRKSSLKSSKTSLLSMPDEQLSVSTFGAPDCQAGRDDVVDDEREMTITDPDSKPCSSLSPKRLTAHFFTLRRSITDGLAKTKSHHVNFMHTPTMHLGGGTGMKWLFGRCWLYK